MKYDAAEALGYLFASFLIAFFIAFLFSFVVQWAWNAVVPHVFGLPDITTYQAFALCVLQSILMYRPKVETKKEK